MKILYNNNGNILNAIYDSDWSKYDNQDLNVYSINETIDNKPIIMSILNSIGKVNEEFQSKFYIKDGDLYEREEWNEIKGFM